MSVSGIAAVVLAAGASRRLGTPKQVLSVGGSPLLAHVLRLCVSAGFDEQVVVLGHEAAAVREALGEWPGVRFVVNEDFAAGQSTSLKTGLLALGSRARAAALFVGDQPELSRRSIDAVLEVFGSGDFDVVRPRYRGVPGHPVVAARPVWPLLLRATGDSGARAMLGGDDIRLREVELDVDPPRDIDTWEDYEAIKEKW
ncbi:NTP transferase domain-containing protein [soil metagenome]